MKNFIADLIIQPPKPVICETWVPGIYRATYTSQEEAAWDVRADLTNQHFHFAEHRL
jgi:hypothetical protein